MKFAAIDLGTSTFKLLIMEQKEPSINQNPLQIIAQHIETVKLGAKGINQNTIAQPAFRRGVAAMKKLASICNSHELKPSQIAAVATSAVRSAKNGADFVAKVHQKTNINVEIIDGNREAELIYIGVKNAFKMSKKPALIIDIGGGSVEFIIANSQQIFWKESVEIGMDRFIDWFEMSDPIANAQQIQIVEHIKQQTQSVEHQIKHYNVKRLVGAANSFETLAEIAAQNLGQIEAYRSQTHFDTSPWAMKKVIHALLQTTTVQRQLMPQIPAARLRAIVPACLLVGYFVGLVGSKQPITTTRFALKEGVCFEGIRLFQV